MLRAASHAAWANMARRAGRRARWLHSEAQVVRPDKPGTEPEALPWDDPFAAHEPDPFASHEQHLQTDPLGYGSGMADPLGYGSETADLYEYGSGGAPFDNPWDNPFAESPFSSTPQQSFDLLYNDPGLVNRLMGSGFSPDTLVLDNIIPEPKDRFLILQGSEMLRNRAQGTVASAALPVQPAHASLSDAFRLMDTAEQAPSADSAIHDIRPKISRPVLEQRWQQLHGALHGFLVSQLRDYLESHGVSTRKSWRKKKLIDTVLGSWGVTLSKHLAHNDVVETREYSFTDQELFFLRLKNGKYIDALIAKSPDLELVFHSHNILHALGPREWLHYVDVSLEKLRVGVQTAPQLFAKVESVYRECGVELDVAQVARRFDVYAEQDGLEYRLYYLNELHVEALRRALVGAVPKAHWTLLLVVDDTGCALIAGRDGWLLTRPASKLPNMDPARHFPQLAPVVDGPLIASVADALAPATQPEAAVEAAEPRSVAVPAALASLIEVKPAAASALSPPAHVLTLGTLKFTPEAPAHQFILPKELRTEAYSFEPLALPAPSRPVSGAYRFWFAANVYEGASPATHPPVVVTVPFTREQTLWAESTCAMQTSQHECFVLGAAAGVADMRVGSYGWKELVTRADAEPQEERLVWDVLGMAEEAQLEQLSISPNAAERGILDALPGQDSLCVYIIKYLRRERRQRHHEWLERNKHKRDRGKTGGLVVQTADCETEIVVDGVPVHYVMVRQEKRDTVEDECRGHRVEYVRVEDESGLRVEVNVVGSPENVLAWVEAAAAYVPRA